MQADVVVVGGGTAGALAAVSAARAGADVLVLEQHGFLGGTMTASSLGSLCGYYTVIDGTPRPVVGGLPLELVAELRRAGASPEQPLMWLRTASVPYDLFSMKLLLDRMVTGSGARILFHSSVVGAARSADGAVQSVTVATRGGFREVHAGVVIDASGDAQVSALAGADFDLDVGHLQAPTTMFRFAGVDTAVMKQISRPELHQHLEAAVQAGFDLPRTAGGMYTVRPGVVHVNITRIDGPLDPFEPEAMTTAEIAGRTQVSLYQEAFRRYVPGFADAFVLDTGVEVGIRESRRIHGDFTLTVDHVTSPARFDDAIACSAWPIEDHSGGRDIRWVWLDPGQYYQIPLRSMLPRHLTNVVVAGRAISATHDAQASVRVTAQCFAMGEAAGVTAVAALEHSGDIRTVDVCHVQQTLRDRGVFLGERITAAPPTDRCNTRAADALVHTQRGE
jgi:hypothetical protein